MRNRADRDEASALCDMLADCEFEFTLTNVRHVLAICPSATDAQCWRELAEWLRGVSLDATDGL